MTTTTTPPATTTPSKRPVTLTIGAILLALVALLTLASPFLPRARAGGNFNPQRTPPPGGFQSQGGTGQGANQGQNDQGGYPGQGSQGQSGQGAQGRGTGRGQGANNFGVLAFAQPIRIGLGIVGALFTLLAAWGIWRRQKWGMVLTLIVAVVILLTTSASLAMPLLGRTALRSFSLLLTFASAPVWQEVATGVAIVAAIVVLLPVSMKGYIVKPKVRRVM